MIQVDFLCLYLLNFTDDPAPSSFQQGSNSTRSSISTPTECSSLHVEYTRAPSSRIRNHERFFLDGQQHPGRSSHLATLVWCLAVYLPRQTYVECPPSHQVELQPRQTRRAGPSQSLAQALLVALVNCNKMDKKAY